MFLYLLIINFPILIYSALNPILHSNNPSAVPVQDFDFVYIPRNVVDSHLPSFYPNQLKRRAERIAKELNVADKVPLDCVKNQVLLVDWYNKNQINKKDPNGAKRKVLKGELERLNSELALLIPKRRNLISDLDRLQQSINIKCPVASRVNDVQYEECNMMKQEHTFIMSELRKLNQIEREILRKELEVRKEFKN